ncbi:MAG: methyltransferase domain-containing protein [Nanoarchaeota archaeon]
MNKDKLIESLKGQGFPSFITDAFSSVQRENFVPENLKDYAYDDISLPIGEAQTISQPYTISFMLNLLELDRITENPEKVKLLEIGSGSGYVLALLSKICPNAEIYGVEIKKEFVIKSKSVLASYKNANVLNKSGFLGLIDNAPYDRILISASSPNVEIIEKISQQLKNNGILVAPVKNSIFQIKKHQGSLKKKEFYGFSFVPLVK